MARPIRLRDAVRFGWVPVNDVKNWLFVEIQDQDGVSVVVEFQGAKPADGRDRILTQMVEELKEVPVDSEMQVQARLGLTTDQCEADSDLSRTVSALCTAIVELQCIHDDLSMTEALGGTPQESQLLYSNLNRYLRDVRNSRSARDFGEAAGRAANEGFTILKTDPFDEVRSTDSTDVILQKAQPSLERLEAMRSAVGPNVVLQVDCHGCFNLQTAPVIVEELNRLGVTWFEDPLRYSRNPDDVSGLRDRIDIPIAAGGSAYGEEAFDYLVDVYQVDFTMQDVMRCGGVGVATRVGQKVIGKGVRTSCHSPFGPLSNLASAHVHAAVRESYALEHAVWENDWRRDLIDPPERVVNGHLMFPGGPGMGATLNWDMLESVGGRCWKI